jgi:hypothetical protein
LFDRREFRSAALGRIKACSVCREDALTVSKVFVEAQKLRKAMKSHERALEWREFFMVASLVELSEEDTVDVAYRVAGMSRLSNSSHFFNYILFQRNLPRRNGILKLGKYY